MFETCSSVYSEIVEGGFYDVVCFCWGYGHHGCKVDTSTRK